MCEFSSLKVPSIRDGLSSRYHYSLIDSDQPAIIDQLQRSGFVVLEAIGHSEEVSCVCATWETIFRKAFEIDLALKVQAGEYRSNIPKMPGLAVGYRR